MLNLQNLHFWFFLIIFFLFIFFFLYFSPLATFTKCILPCRIQNVKFTKFTLSILSNHYRDMYCYTSYTFFYRRNLYYNVPSLYIGTYWSVVLPWNGCSMWFSSLVFSTDILNINIAIYKVTVPFWVYIEWMTFDMLNTDSYPQLWVSRDSDWMIVNFDTRYPDYLAFPVCLSQTCQFLLWNCTNSLTSKSVKAAIPRFCVAVCRKFLIFGYFVLIWWQTDKKQEILNQSWKDWPVHLDPKIFST